MKIAIIPPDCMWYENPDLMDKWFCFKNIKKEINLLYPNSEVDLLQEDMNLEQIDWFIFWGMYNWSFLWYKKLLDIGLECRTIYWMVEPEVVMPGHSKEGIIKLLKIFKYIMTWNPELIDNHRVFYQNILYNFEACKWEGVRLPFIEKKLLVNISGNKSSNDPNELYSERLKVIQYFARKRSDCFDLYGVGWDKKQFSNYLGSCKNKGEIYSQYKFALCLENVKNVKNYITEKILDCIVAEIVPIYWGASNVAEVIPKECFVPYWEFNTIDDLLEFLEGVDEETHNKYIEAGRQFLNSDKVEYFSANTFCKNLNRIFMFDEQYGKPFQVSLTLKKKINLWLYKNKFKKWIWYKLVLPLYHLSPIYYIRKKKKV